MTTLFAKPATTLDRSRRDGDFAMNELDVLRAVSFDWTMHLTSVWSDPPFDVPDLHAELRSELEWKLDQLARSNAPESPLGWVIMGSGGTGKTHLLSILRREARQRGVAFVLVDMTDVHDFWETVLQGYTTSLQQRIDGVQFQYELLLERFFDSLHVKDSPAQVRMLATTNADQLRQAAGRLLTVLRGRAPAETLQYQDVVRVLLALNSQDFDLSSVALTWLQGFEIDDADRRLLGLNRPQEKPMEIVRALSWLMSLCGPTVLALDQLDPIVTQLNVASRDLESEPDAEELRVARTIIERLAGGLSALRDVTRRTLSVVSCVEATYAVLTELTLHTNKDRFEPPRILGAVSRGRVARDVVLSRLEPVFELTGFEPPVPTWPFAVEAFDSINSDLSPRQLLKLCYDHQLDCLRRGAVSLLSSFHADAQPEAPQPEAESHRLDEVFEKLRADAPLDQLLEEKRDDELLGPLLEAACRCVLRETRLPAGVDGAVDVDFGPAGKKTLHARLRLIHHSENSREDHFCVRALQRTHATAFQSRLKNAMTTSGIDRRLSFRRLVLVRTTPLPGGAKTTAMFEKFAAAGGILVDLSIEDLRTLFALVRLEQKNDAEFSEWLRLRRPATQLDLMRTVVPPLCEPTPEVAERREPSGAPSTDEPQPGSLRQSAASNRKLQTPVESDIPLSAPAVPDTASPETPATSETLNRNVLPFGRRVVGTQTGEPLTLNAGLLEKHAVVFAGAGSGKTVLLKRLIEEAALRGIPSIVIDGANDLACLGERWPEPPAGWLDGDAALAEQYFSTVENVIWTPGSESGNPLNLEPLPDLAAVADQPEELEAAVDMAVATLSELVAEGRSKSAQNKRGILTSALKFFAKQGGGTLRQFAELLADLPAEAGLGISKEDRLAAEISDSLKVAMETSAMLRGSGTGLDPAILFGDLPGAERTRISVISLAWLASVESRRHFLNQLAMTLFAWIKQHPSPPGRRLRGLLIIDEAKDSVPATGSSACTESMERLVAQARKYHLGVVFATQNPKDIRHTIVSNCATHCYGKVNSPAARDTLTEMLQSKGGSGRDISNLPRGQFYLHNADATPTPVKVQMPLCLSHHRSDPLTSEEVRQRAAECAGRG
ncbi:DUF87 domain-containing protein [bacterium]|nr:DUF87 domain-containing protein [bacterium]